MIELEKSLHRPFGTGQMPAPLMDFFNWGAFALPEIWGIVHGVWTVVWIPFLAYVIPSLFIASLTAGESVSSGRYYGIVAVAQLTQGAARLWAGMNANKLYWRRTAAHREGTGLFLARREHSLKQFFAKQRMWALVGMLVMIFGSVIGVLWNFSIMEEMSTPTEAVFSTVSDIVWAIAIVGAAYYIARQAVILSAPSRAFGYLTNTNAILIDGKVIGAKQAIGPLNEDPRSAPTGGEGAWPTNVDATSTEPPPGVAVPDPQTADEVFAYPLANQTLLPVLGFGTYRIEEELEAREAVLVALEAGYRSIDTASFYGNEAAIGHAIEASGIPREELFLTSKVWNTEQGYVNTVAAFENSLAALQTDYLDMYLIHWPIEKHLRSTWRALEHLYAAGRIRAIGVCNFEIEHLKRLFEHAHVAPMVNQIELHPRLTREELVLFCWNNGLLVQSWAPLIRGGVSVIPELTQIARTHGKTEAQVALRWAIQHNIAVIPKSTTPARIVENSQIFDFELSDEQMAVIDGLNRDSRVGPDADEFSWKSG